MIGWFQRSSRKAKLGITTTLLAALAALAFGAFALANRVEVSDVQSIAGNRVLVPPADMKIARATWSIDAERSLVTDVDLLVEPNSTVWKMKLFEFFIQVSCLDPGPDGQEGTADDVEFICSTGQARRVWPSHWIGLQPLRIDLQRPVNPETTEIHDLSFIVTNINPRPQTPPAAWPGAMPAQVLLRPGETAELEILGHVTDLPLIPRDPRLAQFQITDLPEGVTADPMEGEFLLDEPGAVPHGRAMVTLSAAPDAQIGERLAMVTLQVGNLEGTSFFDVEIVALDLRGSG